jgi:outer membrane cobalamin receptor
MTIMISSFSRIGTPMDAVYAGVLCSTIACSGMAMAQSVEVDELNLMFGDKRTVSIATGSQQALRRAPAVTSVISAADIAAMGANDLDQILESVPGVHVNRSANNYSPLYVVRGVFSAFTPQVLVLQNGIPMTTLYQGNKGNLWGGYPVEHIARIEVLRGPGSALYGSDAYSGVINIITKNAADTPGTVLGMRVGSFATRDGWLQHGGKLGPFELSAYLRAGKTDGFNSVVDADAQSRNDALFGTHASLAPGPVHTGYDALDANLDVGLDKWRLRAGYKLRDKLGTGAGIASALDPVGKGKSERISADLSWIDPQFGQQLSLGFTLSSLQYVQLTPVDYQLLPPGLRFPTGAFPNGLVGGPDTWERQLRLSAFASYSGFRSHSVRIGIGHDDLDLYRTHETRNFDYSASGTPIPLPAVVDFSGSNPFLKPQRRKIDFLYVQDEWTLAPDWAMTAGLRHDHYSDFGGTTNPRVALVWDAALDLTAKMLYGRAFRAPAFIESYGISNPVALGNPKLRPETNQTLEMAFAWQARADTLVNLTFYRYTMDNIIRTVPNPMVGTGATYANTGSQRGHGVELEAAWDLTRELHLVGNYAGQRSVDEKSGLDAGYAPRHHWNGRADWQCSSDLLLSAQVNRVAGRKRSGGDLRLPIADYTTLDMTLATNRGAHNWNLSATVRNLFNGVVLEPSLAPGLALPHDLPMAPRTLSVQLSYQL